MLVDGAGAAWSRLFWLEPESAPGPRTSGAGAAQKSGGSTTLPCFSQSINVLAGLICSTYVTIPRDGVSGLRAHATVGHNVCWGTITFFLIALIW